MSSAVHSVEDSARWVIISYLSLAMVRKRVPTFPFKHPGITSWHQKGFGSSINIYDIHPATQPPSQPSIRGVEA